MRHKLEKLIGKLEKQYSAAGPVQRKRLARKASKIQSKLNRLNAN